MADENQKTVCRWDNQEAFGANPPSEDPDGDGVAFDFPMRFPGQYADRKTNLAYNMARDYAAEIGRYVESDPIGITAGLNTYAYVTSKPLLFYDVFSLDKKVPKHRIYGYQFTTHVKPSATEKTWLPAQGSTSLEYKITVWVIVPDCFVELDDAFYVEYGGTAIGADTLPKSEIYVVSTRYEVTTYSLERL